MYTVQYSYVWYLFDGSVRVERSRQAGSSEHSWINLINKTHDGIYKYQWSL